MVYCALNLSGKGVPVDALEFSDDEYLTAPQKLSLTARWFPSLDFYWHAFLIVFGASRKAKRGRYGTAEWCGSSLATLRALERVGVRVQVTGIRHFRDLPGPCVFIGNHMSTLETFVLPVIISTFRESTFVVKQSLVEYPIFKYVMRSRNPITVGRSNARDDLKAVLEGGTERLKAGTSIVIFPQTTRTAVFDPEAFNTIGVKLAKKAGVPVVPVALKTDAWGNGRWLKDYGEIRPELPVYFAFGEPMQVRDRGTEEHEATVAFIQAKLGEWGRQSKIL
jgi:1-acyl-sn-glycerol-3-phosphate acyltransferase